jgi:ribokinase
MDLVTRAPRLPRGGETLIGESFATVSGGKGANQAVAAARLGAQVAMVGCVGSDAYGVLREALLAERIDCQAVSTVDGSSGVALIVVDDNSQNAIVIVAGANGADASGDRLLRCGAAGGRRDHLPAGSAGCDGRPCAQAWSRAGQDRDPQPGAGQSSAAGRLVRAIDYLIPNESEAAALSGVPVDSAIGAIRRQSVDRDGGGQGHRHAWGRGSLFNDGKAFEHFPAPR